MGWRYCTYIIWRAMMARSNYISTRCTTREFISLEISSGGKNLNNYNSMKNEKPPFVHPASSLQMALYTTSPDRLPHT